jgi:hypothetical protein
MFAAAYSVAEGYRKLEISALKTVGVTRFRVTPR